MRAFQHSGIVSLLISFWTLLTCASYPNLDLPVRYVHQWPLPTYVQSLYVRANGDILITTVFPRASIYAITDVLTDEPKLTLIKTFEEINAVTGIIEMKPDVFAFMGGMQSSLGVGIDGTFGIWELDLRPARGAYTGDIRIQELVHLSEAGLIGSFDLLPGEPTTLLVADTFKGVVWRVDTKARTYELAARDKHMRWLPWFLTHFGISGVKIHKGYVYWMLSYAATIYRMPITANGYAEDGVEAEEVQWIRSVFVDNFSFGPDGDDTIWAAENAGNRLIAVGFDGKIVYGAGYPDTMTLVGPTATAFGRAEGDTNTAYVVTNGGMLNPVNGSILEGGRLVAVDTTRYYQDPAFPVESFDVKSELV